MFHIILYQPEIPPNTGNIIRLAANTGATLHLIHPLGFVLEDKQLQRAGLDYHDLACVQEHETLDSCLTLFDPEHVFALSAKANTLYNTPVFQKNDAFLFGPETRGLGNDILSTFDEAHRLRLPQLTSARSLNLANTVSIVIYEAWRQGGFRLA